MNAEHPDSSSASVTDRISAAIVDLYRAMYGDEQTTAVTYINDKVVVCVLENILTAEEAGQTASSEGEDEKFSRIEFQQRTEADFKRAVEQITGCKVTAALTTNQPTPDVACELFFLDEAPAADR